MIFQSLLNLHLQLNLGYKSYLFHLQKWNVSIPEKSLCVKQQRFGLRLHQILREM